MYIDIYTVYTCNLYICWSSPQFLVPRSALRSEMLASDLRCSGQLRDKGGHLGYHWTNKWLVMLSIRCLFLNILLTMTIHFWGVIESIS